MKSRSILSAIKSIAATLAVIATIAFVFPAGINAQAVATAVTVKTQFAEANGRKIAYRSVGNGKPVILCNRFRGILDDWDPAFIDSLAANFRVIIFDYSGIGLSTGAFPEDALANAKDVTDLANFLQLDRFIIGGWSHGGLVAQTVITQYPQLVSHAVLIGTGPPGKNEHPPEKIFIERALKPVNDLDDEMILFFEPASEASVKAGKLSHERIAKRLDRDVKVKPDMFEKYFKVAADYTADKYNAREKLAALKIPILVISGDHEIVFPVENWYALTRKLPNLHLVVLPQAGHGPQHQYPELASGLITNFIQTIN